MLYWRLSTESDQEFHHIKWASDCMAGASKAFSCSCVIHARISWVASAEALGCLNCFSRKRSCSHHHVKITQRVLNFLWALRILIRSTHSLCSKSFSRGSDSTAGLNPTEKTAEMCDYTCRITPWVAIQISITTLHV